MKKLKFFTSIIALVALFVFGITDLAHAGQNSGKIRDLIGQWIEKLNVGPETGPAEIVWLLTPGGNNEIIIEQSQCVLNCRNMSLGKFSARLRFTPEGHLKGVATRRTVPTPQVRRCSSNPTYTTDIKGFVSSDNRTIILKTPTHRWYNTHICAFANTGGFATTLSKK